MVEDRKKRVEGGVIDFKKLCEPFPPERVALFLDKVIPEPNSGCWLWIGSTNRHGYGNFWHDGKCHKAHRFSYMAFVSQIPDGKDIMHKCDVRCCVNPEHLAPGTALQNVVDMWRKGRARPSRGMANGRARLTTDGVQRIKEMVALGYEYSYLARLFRIDRSTVARAARGQSWRTA